MERKRNGEGTFFYKINGIDSVKFGLWHEDLFVKKIYLKPYQIIKQIGVTRHAVLRKGDGQNVVFTIMQSGIVSNKNLALQFSESSGFPLDFGQKQGLENVRFPFTCKLTFSTPNALRTSYYDVDFEIKITEPGFWEIVLTIG